MTTPTREEIDRCFTALLDGTRTREDVAGWARRQQGVTDQVRWLALTMLHGADLRIIPGGPYLHSDDQVRRWLDAYRGVCATTPD